MLRFFWIFHFLQCREWWPLLTVKPVFLIRILDLDPHWFCYPGSRSGSVSRMRIWIQIQEQGNLPKLTNKPDFHHFKMVLVQMRYFLWQKSIFFTPKHNFLWWHSLTGIWIRIRMDPHWFGSLNLSPDVDSDWGKRWIWIHLETNADPKHWLKLRQLVTFGVYMKGVLP